MNTSYLENLPQGWEMKKLGDIAEVVGGGTPKTINTEYWEGGNIVWLSPVDLPPIGKITKVISSGKMITSLGLSKSSARLLPIGSLMYSSRASIGKIGIAKVELSTNQGFVNFLPNPEVYHVKYLSYTLVRFTPEITSLSNSTTFKEVSRTNVKNFQIPLPPLPEQKRIADKLDAIFTRLDQAVKNIEENIKSCDELMASVLDSAFSGAEEKYGMSIIESICSKVTDGTHSTPKYIQDGIPFLSVKNISKGIMDFSNTKFISYEEHTKLIKRCNPEYGDILYTKVGTTGIAKLIDTRKDFSIFVSVALLKLNNHVDGLFLEYTLNAPKTYKQAQSKTRGVANRNLVIKDIKSISIPLPPLDEQKRIAEHLDLVSAKKKALKSKYEIQLQNFKDLKASILDSAFKGEL